MLSKELIIASEEQQTRLGHCLAAACGDNAACIFLQGDLGAGKTTLARGFLRGLGYQDKVKSPTYPLIEVYDLPARVVLHIDLYRIVAADEVAMLGIADQYSNNTIALIEWPEKAKDQLPSPDLTCYIAPFEQGRRVTMVATSTRGQEILTTMVAKWHD